MLNIPVFILNWNRLIIHKLNTNRKIYYRTSQSYKHAKSYIEDVEIYAEDAGCTDNEFLARVSREGSNKIRSNCFKYSRYSQAIVLPGVWSKKIKHLRECKRN
jgi:2-isopropylmalate synthase